MNRLSIELKSGVIRQIKSTMDADKPEEICLNLFMPMLVRLGYSLNDIDKCFNVDYIKRGD